MTAISTANQSLDVMRAIDAELLAQSQERLAAKVEALIKTATIAYPIWKMAYGNRDEHHYCHSEEDCHVHVALARRHGHNSVHDGTCWCQLGGDDRWLLGFSPCNDLRDSNIDAARYAHTMGICSFYRGGYEDDELDGCMICRAPRPSQDEYDAQFCLEALLEPDPVEPTVVGEPF